MNRATWGDRLAYRLWGGPPAGVEGAMNEFRQRFAEAQQIPGWSARMDALIPLLNEDPVAYVEASRAYWSSIPRAPRWRSVGPRGCDGVTGLERRWYARRYWKAVQPTSGEIAAAAAWLQKRRAR